VRTYLHSQPGTPAPAATLAEAYTRVFPQVTDGLA
jgi:hypothetical protein